MRHLRIPTRSCTSAISHVLSRTAACAADLAVFADILIHSVSANAPNQSSKKTRIRCSVKGRSKRLSQGGGGQKLQNNPPQGRLSADPARNHPTHLLSVLSLRAGEAYLGVLLIGCRPR